MRYTILPPNSNSTTWEILDDRGEIVFSGLHQQCEEWLDLADLNETVRIGQRVHTTDQTPRRPIYNLAASLLGSFWEDSAGEVRVPGDAPTVLLMLMAVAFISSHVVGSAIAQQASLIPGASAVACVCPHRGTCAGTHCESSCASSPALDMACDDVD